MLIAAHLAVAPITQDEVIKYIAKLHNGKTCGHDKVLNEFLKHSRPVMSKFDYILSISSIHRRYPREVGY